MVERVKRVLRVMRVPRAGAFIMRHGGQRFSNLLRPNPRKPEGVQEESDGSEGGSGDRA